MNGIAFNGSARKDGNTAILIRYVLHELEDEGINTELFQLAGSIHAFDTLNHFFFISQMIVPGSRYWNMGFGLEKGEVEKDEEGILTMKVLGRNMAWLLKRINH